MDWGAFVVGVLALVLFLYACWYSNRGADE